jgi:hypothetical protein
MDVILLHGVVHDPERLVPVRHLEQGVAEGAVKPGTSQRWQPAADAEGDVDGMVL